MPTFKKILCPTDFSEESLPAIDKAVQLARNEGAELLIVHIIHIPSAHVFEGTHVLSVPELQRRGESLLHEATAKRLGGYSKAELLVEVGEPLEELTRMANEKGVDLIVIATHGRTGVQRLLIGSLTEKLVRHAPCAVLVVR